jgi:8-oxo-dGTP diphosphatase
MEIPEIKQYNIRVYGILINKKNEVLLTDEFFHGVHMTKFPGGGMNFGEGPADCLLREALEEFGQEVEIISHVYTTHFFQRSLFFPDQQLISIYYRIKFRETPRIKISTGPSPEMKDGDFSFRWASVETLTPEDLTLPVDKHVAGLLKNSLRLPDEHAAL